MKKITSLIMIIYIITTTATVTYGSIVSIGFAKLMPAVAAVSQGVISLPARVAASTNTGASALQWMSMQLPPARTAKIAGMIIGIGAGFAADYLYREGKNWFDSKNMLRENGVLKVLEESQYYNPPTGWVPPYQTNPSLIVGYYSSNQAASDALAAINVTPRTTNSYTEANGFRYWWFRTYSQPNNMNHNYVAFVNATPTTKITTKRDVTEQELVNLLTTDIANNNTEALKIAMAGVKTVADAVDNPRHDVRNYPPVWQAINGEMAASLSQAQRDALLAAAQQAGSDEWAKEMAKAALENPALTPSEIQDILEQALKDKTLTKDNVKEVLDGERVKDAEEAQNATVPGALAAIEEQIETEKGSIKPILQAFTNAVQSLPILSFLTNMQVTASGSSVLTFPLPGLMGGSSGTASIDFGQWQSTFMMMGNILLAVTGIRWTIYLFSDLI